MVWRKKKVAISISETSSVVAPHSGGDGPAGNAQTEGAKTEGAKTKGAMTEGAMTEATGAPGTHSTGLRPQNRDLLPGSWIFDADEFKVPVRSQGARRAYTIPRNYRITGDVTSARRVVVEGEFAGGALDAPTVTVRAGGCLRGRVKATNVQVAGVVDAEVAVSEALEVSGRGWIAGNICAPQVKVWPGAVLHGAILKVGGL